MLQTAAILYMQTITGSFTRLTTLLYFLHSFFSHLGTTPTYVLSAYSSGFFEPVTYIIPISHHIPSVIVEWNICHDQYYLIRKGWQDW